MSSLYFVGDLNILADLRLSANDKLVYFCLVSFMNKRMVSVIPGMPQSESELGYRNAPSKDPLNTLPSSKL